MGSISVLDGIFTTSGVRGLGGSDGIFTTSGVRGLGQMMDET